MSFSFIFLKKSAPEWKLCYYDYLDANQIIVLCRKAYTIRCNIEDLIKEDNYSIEDNSSLLANKEVLAEIKNSRFEQIQEIVEKANVLFYRYHSLNKRVVFVFLQFKIHQLNARISRYAGWQGKISKTQHNLTKLLSNTYAETIKLQELTNLHIQAYENIYNKHHQNFNKFNLTTPNLRTARLFRSLQDYKRLEARMNKVMESNKQIVQKETEYKRKQEIQPSPLKISFLSYMFGLLNGFSVCTIIAAIIVLAINMSGKSDDLVSKKLTFANQYKLWRCTGLITMLLWIMAISFYIYQRKRINYHLILDFSPELKKSSKSLTAATLSILLWSSFFVFYALDMLDIYKVVRVSWNPDYPITIFFPLMILGLLLIAVIFQFIWVRTQAAFYFSLFSRIIFSLFGVIQISFNLIWATQQLTSLFKIVNDLVYSICYYSRMLQTPTSGINYCLNYGFRIIPECFAILVFLIRLLQCIRLAVENGKFVGTLEMVRSIRVILHIVLASLSISLLDGKSWAIFDVWVCIGVITAIYSFVVDIFFDWHLFRFQNGKMVRKQHHIFSTDIIILMVVCNLIGRFFFLLTFSANLVFAFIPYPELITTIAAYVELGRRLIWNLLRMQNQQIKNNYYFQIRTDYDKNEEKIMKQLVSNQQTVEVDKLSEERSQKQIELLRNLIREKVKKRQEINKFCQENHKILQNIEDDSEQQILSLIQKEQ